MGGEELKFIQEAFDTNWISPVGPNISAFEHALTDYVGTGYAAALSSGTAAMHLALIILGIQQGDEVLCQSFTFAGSVNPVVYQGAKPVLIDSEPGTWNMDPALLEEAIQARRKQGTNPKAIIYVHLYGMPARVNDLQFLSDKYEIPLIEDAAEALGASYHNSKVGKFGIMSVLSFNGNKIITTSGGGALLSNNRDFIEQAKFLATQARDEAPHYQHSQIGYNYRLSNICAGIGRGQMMVLDERVRARRRIFSRYYDALSGSGVITFPKEEEGHFSNRWLTCIELNSPELKNRIYLALAKENIESRPLWKPMHLQPVFERCDRLSNGISEDLFNRGLCLPSGSNLSNEDQERIIGIILKIIQ